MPKRKLTRLAMNEINIAFLYFILNKYLIKNKITDDQKLKSIKKEIEKEVITAHNFAKNSPYPKENELEKYVFKK